ncbi:hypothetical protein [Dickeya sp. NCPPB 3274]|uniref:hypothetical protein n=1 Tax=Dickeya sp. NCPPB 3274 TaxID=568766 RepID=UPI0005B34B3F|nr:hypothetical protein [Dickeya sp. NCPPB 3274]
MNTSTIKVILFFAVINLGGCATVFSDNHSDVVINSIPPGAEVFSYPENKRLGVTPVTVRASPDNRFFILKKDQYKKTPVALGIGTNKVSYLNGVSMVFFPIANTVDTLTDNKYKIKETSITVTMEKQ